MAHSKMQLTTKISGERDMRAKRHFPVIYCLSFLISFSVVLGDGKVFIWRNKNADIFQPTQKAYIKWNGSEEKLLLQTKYEGPAEEMVWIVPVPSEPKVKKGDPNAFERLSKETQSPDLAYTHFWRLSISTPVPGMSGKRTAVKWRRQIGDYDVALLSPVGGEHVIEWLNSNEFGVPEEAVPILQDYIKDQWWMVAARIHPDALTDITREKLAEGTLHPLEMIFKAPKCVYPLRLTSLVAGPVEELIYIEGPAHYEPVTLRNYWEIDVFGGPKQEVPNGYRLSAVEHAMRIVEGKTESNAKRYLTKLRRVFKPEEMIEDIIFDKIDYAKLFSSGDPIRIGEAATQYGRHRDPAGVPYLLKSLSPELLDGFRPSIEEQRQLLSASTGFQALDGLMKQKEMCKHVRSCIWALGEIAIAHGADSAAETTLLRCAEHESQIIRMEAYIALTKLNSSGIGPILLDRFKQTFSGDLAHLVSSDGDWLPADIPEAELEIVTEWLERFGTAQEKNAFVDVLSNVIANLPVDPSGLCVGKYHIAPVGIAWWPVWQAALTQDPRLLRPLKDYRVRYPETDRYLHMEFLLKAEAACGSHEAISILASRTVKDQGKVLREREARKDGGYAFLQPFHQSRRWDSIRTWILRKREYRKESYRRMPTKIDDAVIRTAVSEHELDDWYVLYLLSYIEEFRAADTERVRIIWNKKDSGKQLVAVAVLWTWKDTRTLLELHEQCADEAVAAEIQRALDYMENQGD
ncbi:DUF2330 domain-containing protein [Planctomycetota bacterium]